MARPHTDKVLEGVSSDTTSDGIRTSGHNSIGLYVHLSNLDSGADSATVTLQASPDDGATWFDVHYADGTTANIEVSDADTNGNAMAFVHGLPADEVRANITSFTDSAGGDLTADVWIAFANNSGKGYSSRQR